MKQIIISIIILSIALALVIGVINPIFEHSASTGHTAVIKGHNAISRIGQVVR